MAKVGCYAVARGRSPGVYMEWSDCEAQVINFKGAKYKKFLHAADAELWVHQNAVGPYAAQSIPPVSAPSAAAQQTGVKSPEVREPPSPQALNAKPVSSSAKAREASSSLQGGERAISEEPPVLPQHPTLSTTGSGESVTSSTMSSNTLIVYTDGSCKRNGQVGGEAGVGVWWGKDDPRNISERCPGQQTNNRAELIAIIRVLEISPRDRPLLIKSDSEYSINSMTKWIWTWKTRGWRTSTGAAVQNLPVIKYLDILLEERRRVLKQSVEFEKVLAHSGLEGNEGADVLAKAGAALPPVPDLDWEVLAQEVRDRIEAAPSSQASASGRAGSVPRTTPSPPKTKVQSVPKQPVVEVSQALPARPSPPPPPPARIKKSSPSPTVLSSARSASPTISRQSSLSQATSTSTSSTSTSTSASGRTPRIPLSLSDVLVHGRVDVEISQAEKEAFAACLLDDEDFIREAQEAGL